MLYFKTYSRCVYRKYNVVLLALESAIRTTLLNTRFAIRDDKTVNVLTENKVSHFNNFQLGGCAVSPSMLSHNSIENGEGAMKT